ncbi:cysteine biosynthesis protein [Rhizobium albus]|nr:cysteine biosynthesis protein [Rhizobium albus]
MIFSSIRLAIADLFAPESRSAFWKVIGLTLLMLVGLWFLVTGVFSEWTLPWLQGFFPDMPEWTSTAGFLFGILASIALALGLAFLIAPISVLIAGLFLDDVAEAIERRHYGDRPVGQALSLRQSIPHTLKFLGIVILGNLLALMLLFIPLVNLMAFFVVNAYLLSREFFEFAAMRYHTPADAKQLRSRHGTTVFFAGIAIAAFLAIPILNLLTPLFAAALMVHLHQRVVAKDPEYALTARAPTPATVR